MRHFAARWALILLPVFLWSCVGADAPFDLDDPNGDIDPFDTGPSPVKLYDNVLVGDEDPCLVDVEFEEDREVLEFIFACDPEGRGYEAGVIVVGTVHGGYLRRIVSTELNDQTITAWTEEASLAEVIQEGEISQEIKFGEDARTLINLNGTILWSGDVGPASVLATLPRAAFDIDPAVVIKGHWADGEMQTFDFDLGLDLDADLALALTSTNGLRYSTDKSLWTYNWPFAFAIGPVPVAGVLEMQLKIGFRADAPGHMTVTTGASGEMSIHNRKFWRNGEGWYEDDINEGEWELSPPDLQVSSKAKVRAYARLDSTLKLYGVVGPRFRTEVGTQVTAKPNCEGIDYELEADVSGSGAITLNLFDRFKPSKTFLKITFTADLMDGTIQWPLGNPLPCDEESIMCGQTVEGDTRDNLNPVYDGYSCHSGIQPIGNYQAPEIVYQWKATKSGPVVWELIDPEPNLINHDLFVVKGMWDLALGNCETWGLNDVEFEAVAGQTYYLIVDGSNTDSGTYEAKLTCDEDNPFSNDGDTSNPF